MFNNNIWSLRVGSAGAMSIAQALPTLKLQMAPIQGACEGEGLHQTLGLMTVECL